jgi:hypothetical protein
MVLLVRCQNSKINEIHSKKYSSFFSDSEQKITDFCEREVSWVHATLLNFEDELDVRINVQTSELEDQNNELKKFVFPDGKVVGKIVQEDVHGRLIVTNALTEEVRSYLYNSIGVYEGKIFCEGEGARTYK